MAEGFKVGDIVQLKSGGPKMTVTEDKVGIRNDHVRTNWFAGSKHESGMFPIESLVPATDDKSK